MNEGAAPIPDEEGIETPRDVLLIPVFLGQPPYLMKKVLRRTGWFGRRAVLGAAPIPDEEGIETETEVRHLKPIGAAPIPDEEGIETNISFSQIGEKRAAPIPDEEGIETVDSGTFLWISRGSPHT